MEQVGFFTKKETQSLSRPNGKKYSCSVCGLYKDSETPRMEPFGNFKKGILNIGSTYSKLEDHLGKPWQSASGRLLEKTYKELGIDLFEDCLNINSVRCYMGEDKPPSNYSIEACRSSIFKFIEKYKPKTIILFGFPAIYSFIGSRWQKNLGTIAKWRGWAIPDQDFKAWVCPVYHPDFIISSKSSYNSTSIEKTIWEQDLRQALKTIEKPFLEYKKPKIKYIKDLSILDEIDDEFGFDYETTGLKPHAEGQRIVCASIAINENNAYAFMMPQKRKNAKPFINLLKNPNIPKTAHNLKFEEAWSSIKLNQPVANWKFDSMIAAHILDNRTGITSLKFQSYVQFGIVDYDSEISPYLRGNDKKDGGNAINQIMKLANDPIKRKKLLEYDALDSIHETRLAKIQRSIISKNPNFQKAYKLFHEGIIAFSRAEQQGFRVDMDYVEKKKVELTRKINRVEKRFKETNFYKHWVHSFSSKVNIDSDTQLRVFLYNIKKLKPSKLTTSGKGSTDEDTLKKLNLPELNLLIQRSKLKRLRDVNLDGYSKEQINNHLHPFFNLHLPVTYRSSMDRPNLQNVPARDEESMKICRKALYPRPGHQLVEIDFKGIEVAINACYNKDPNLIKYVSNLKLDMHADMAKEIFVVDGFDKKIPEHYVLRQATKNGFVFPQFYGDYYKNNAISLLNEWCNISRGKFKPNEGIPMPEGTLSDHFIKVGLNSFRAFENHLRIIEKDFWENRFPEYAEWKKRWWSQYKRRGYIDLLTGFRCSGLMNMKEVCNYPGQGSAFHCLLWTFIELDKRMVKEKWDSRLISQVHDSVILDVHPDEREHVIKVAKRIATVELPKAWPWIIVPLEVDVEYCPIDASWCDKVKK